MIISGLNLWCVLLTYYMQFLSWSCVYILLILDKWTKLKTLKVSMHVRICQIFECTVSEHYFSTMQFKEQIEVLLAEIKIQLNCG